MNTQYKTTKINGTWLGNRGEQTTALKTSRTLGERVVAIRWIDGHDRDGFAPGDVELKHIKGDAWRKAEAFVEYDRKVIANGTDEDIEAYINERLGN